MATVAVIPARSGSKRLVGKNTLQFAGKPLIVWSIEAATEAGIGTVIVTTDGDEIASIAAEAGAVVVRRPANLATDEASTLDTVRHAVEGTHASTIVLLQPTSPLRTSDDVKSCLDLHQKKRRPVVSVTKTTSWPYWMAADGSIQAAENGDAVAVAPNGAVYICSAEGLASSRAWYDEPIGFLMPASRSVDIDTIDDFRLAEFYAAQRRHELTFEDALNLVVG